MHHVALDEGSLFAVRNSVGIASGLALVLVLVLGSGLGTGTALADPDRLPATQVWSPRRPLNRPRHPLWFAANTRAGAVPVAAGPAVGQNPTPFTGTHRSGRRTSCRKAARRWV